MKNKHISAFKVILSVLTALLAGTVYSCVSPDKDPALSIEPQVTSIEFSADGKTAIANGQAVSATFSVTTNQEEWSVELSEKDSWLRSDRNGDKFTLSADANEGFDARRPITVMVKSGKASDVTFSVTQKGSEKPAHDIYISGMLETVDYDRAPVLWTNGELTILGDEDIILTGMDLSDRGVYLSGVRESDYSEQAVYWNNGSFTTLPDNGLASGAMGVAIAGNDVFIAGLCVDYEEFITYPVYWKNGIMHELAVSGVPGAEYAVNGITVSGNDHYVFGKAYDYYAGSAGAFPVYWKNGEINYVNNAPSEDVLVRDMAVNGSDVYILGSYEEIDDEGGGKTHDGYWKNDRYISLASSGREAIPFAIEVYDGDVYMAGVAESTAGNEMAVYWKNGQMVVLDDSGAALDIAVCEGHVYVLGVKYLESEEGDMERLCYWIDGANRVDIPDMTFDLWEALYGIRPWIAVSTK